MPSEVRFVLTGGFSFLPIGKGTIAMRRCAVKAGMAGALRQLSEMWTSMEDTNPKKLSRIQTQNRHKIMEAALDVFSQHGFRGATLDQIADAAGLSKPNMLYYFDGKSAIHVELLNNLMAEWLAPMREIDPEGEPLEEILRYVRRKLEMSREFPRESRLFANEIIQGAPRMGPHLETGLKPLVDEIAAVIGGWIEAGKLAPVDPRHLIFSIWATTQHYADFDAQVQVLMGGEDAISGAETYLDTLYRRLLTP
jgi:TetR/AcrR family transcriptional regulator